MTLDVTWIALAARRPLCDVPWLGNSVVLADGSVNFCCFSSAVVGNVNGSSFDEVWNGKAMQRIRKALANQVLPPECQSTSCPIYRGDDRHYVLDRMDGPNGFRATGNSDPHQAIRERLAGSVIRLTAAAKGTLPGVTIDFRVKEAPVKADLFVALTGPDGKTVFLPDSEDYAVPFKCWLELCPQDEPQSIEISQPRSGAVPGNYKLCAALFDCSQNPNLLSNCYWSSVAEMSVK